MNKLNTQTLSTLLMIVLCALLTFAIVYLPLSHAQDNSDSGYNEKNSNKNQKDPSLNQYSDQEVNSLATNPNDLRATEATNPEYSCPTCAKNTYKKPLTEVNPTNDVTRTLNGNSKIPAHGKDPSESTR